MPKPQHFLVRQVHELGGALQAAAQPGALVRAGGVDVQDRLDEGIDRPDTLVDLRGVSELGLVRLVERGISLGPLVTLDRLALDDRLPQALRQAAACVGTREVRAKATLGGNLAQRMRCWYFRSDRFHCARKGGEGCPAREGQHEAHAVFDNDLCAAVQPSSIATALVALGARLTLRTAQEERPIEAEEFFVSPKQDVTRENVLRAGELIVEVLVPLDAASGYVKTVNAGMSDWPLAEAAVALRLEDQVVRGVRIALGAVAPTPRRAFAAESALLNQRPDDGLIARAARLALEGATPLPRNRAKLEKLEHVVERALREALRAPESASGPSLAKSLQTPTT